MIVLGQVPGSLNWIDLDSPDVPAAAEFYGTLFGWRLTTASQQPDGSGRFTLCGRQVAGIGPLPGPNARSSWTISFNSPDIEGTTQATVRAGGQIVVGPVDLAGTAGRRCTLLDNTGGAFAALQPKGDRGLQVVNTDGSLCWAELHTTDPVAAGAFYHSVFGWIVEDVPMPHQANYALARPAGTDPNAVQAGIVGMSQPMRAAGFTPAWEPCFQVSDCDRMAEAAVEAGGGISAEPTDLPLLGRVARLTDLHGASFAIVAGTRNSADHKCDMPVFTH